MSASVAITRGLSLGKQFVLVLLFVVLFGWASIASYLANARARVEVPLKKAYLSEDTTEQNVEPRVRDWVDAFSLETKKVDEPTCYFAFKVTLQNGMPIGVLRTKVRAHYLTLQAVVTLTPEQKAMVGRLSERDKEMFYLKLLSEAAKAKVAFQWDTPPRETLTVERRLPIANSLTEATLLDNIGEVNFSALVLMTFIQEFLGQQVTPPSPTPNTEVSPH